jgi:hypothetical protein
MDELSKLIKPDPPDPQYLPPAAASSEGGLLSVPPYKRGPFVPLQGGADGPAGLLLAINPQSVSHISSVWDKKLARICCAFTPTTDTIFASSRATPQGRWKR